VTLDKGRKIAIGVARLRDCGADHIMPFDADDLLHRDLAGFVASDPHAFGRVSDSGLMYLQDTRLLWEIPNGFGQRNGSIHVVRTDLIPIPPEISSESSIAELESLIVPGVLTDLIGKHRAWQSWAEEAGHPLAELPFSSAIWVVGTGENQSQIDYHSGPPVKIDAAITEEFGLQRPPFATHLRSVTQTRLRRACRALGMKVRASKFCAPGLRRARKERA